MATGFTQRLKGKIFVPGGSLGQFGHGASSFGLSGNIYEYLANPGTGNGNDTTEDTLGSFTLPPNSFDQAGRMLWLYAFGSFANNAHSKTAKLYFGALALSSGAITTANIGWALELLVCKTGAGTQIAQGQIINGTTHGGVTLPLAGSETDTAGILIKATGQTGTAAAGDVILNGLIVGAAN